MNDEADQPPRALSSIAKRTAELGFGMACDSRTGALLRALAAMPPAGRMVELGTGTGTARAGSWMAWMRTLA